MISMTEIGTCEGNNSEESRVGRVSVILAAACHVHLINVEKSAPRQTSGTETASSPKPRHDRHGHEVDKMNHVIGRDRN